MKDIEKPQESDQAKYPYNGTNTFVDIGKKGRYYFSDELQSNNKHADTNYPQKVKGEAARSIALVLFGHIKILTRKQKQAGKIPGLLFRQLRLNF